MESGYEGSVAVSLIFERKPLAADYSRILRQNFETPAITTPKEAFDASITLP